MTSLRGIFPQPKVAPKRNFIKENVKKLAHISRRNTPQEDVSTSRKSSIIKPKTATINNKPPSRKTPNAAIPVTIIKAAPEHFHKSKSDYSLNSFSSNQSVLDTPKEKFGDICSVNSASAGRDADSQTGDIEDEDFLKGTIIRHPSASVLDKIRDDVQSMYLDSGRNVSNRRGNRKVLARIFREDDMDDDALISAGSNQNHEFQQSQHLERLQEFVETNSVKTRKTEESPFTEQEKQFVKGYHKLVDRRREKFAAERLAMLSQPDDMRSTSSTSTNFLDSTDRGDGKRNYTPNGNLPSSYRKGEVPRYLREMKEKREQQQLLETMVDADCPPGHIALSETERLEALGFAHEKFKELVTNLNMLPMTTQTLKVKQRKMEIDRELDKLEESIRIFSRPKVYVKLDE